MRVSDLANALESVRYDRDQELPSSPYSIENLRLRLRPLTEDICEVARRGGEDENDKDEDEDGGGEDGNQPGRRFYQAVRNGSRGVKVLGGASLVVADIIVAANPPTWPAALASALSGLGLMLDQVADLEDTVGH